MPAQRTITILGATGSVGTSTVDLIGRHPDRFRVLALTANSNVELLAAQARRLRPEVAVVADEAYLPTLRDALSGSGIETAGGADAICDAAARPSDLVMAGIVGAVGLAPTLVAVRRGAIVAFANKECLVSAGPLMMAEVAKHGAKLLPVDSEHNAIFQCFEDRNREAIDRLILTASGGPFRTWSLDGMARVTPVEAVAHPNWDMGAKISVDSATMMNKGLEIIEAHYLFDIPESRIEVLVHPQSIIHSMVSYIDGSTLAQLGTPDMRTPIAYALAWPERIPGPAEGLDLGRSGELTFEAPDSEKFPALSLARAALTTGAWAPPVLNAANEVAVAAFLAGEIGFLDIAGTVARVMDNANLPDPQTLDDVRACDTYGRTQARNSIALRHRAAE